MVLSDTIDYKIEGYMRKKSTLKEEGRGHLLKESLPKKMRCDKTDNKFKQYSIKGLP
jgi:hypothetical protein